ncbi:MAG: hypothetical protein K6E59_03925 [Bacilli bacterium]|nr:hypothetical protein [Bacilli bacterium]
MAITVLPKKFKARCPRCFAEFVYEADDLKFDLTNMSPYLSCPVCGKRTEHVESNEIKESGLPGMKKVG